MRNLTALIPTENLVAWYPLNDVTVAGAAASVTDESGNINGMAATGLGADRPNYELNTLNSRPGIVFNEESPLVGASAVTIVRDIFIVTKYTGGANFGGSYRGLLSDEASNPLLLGHTGTTRFFDLSPLVFTYRKSQTNYAVGNMQAPFTNFELIQLTSGTGWSLDGIQLGQDRADTGRRWIGKVPELILYSTVQSAAKQKRIELYFDLKFGLWLLHGTTLNFPSPSMVGLIGYEHFYDVPKSWEDVTDFHEYEDRGRSFNRVADAPPREWQLRIDCNANTHAESRLFTNIYDEFWDVVGIDRTFSFTDKYGETHTGVRVKSYSRSHEAHRSWIQPVTFRLVKYP